MAAFRLASSACRVSLRPAFSVAPIKRAIATTAVCRKQQVSLPTDSEHAVGIEKFEMEATSMGIEDPWDFHLQLGDGTRENPTIIPSMYNKRLIGHLCEEDQTHLVYFYVYKGTNNPKRCTCGHWFKCVDAEPHHF